MKPGLRGQPRIVFLHFSAPPIVGGVEAVIAEHVRLCAHAGFKTLIIAGREASGGSGDIGQTVIIPEMDSENPGYLELVEDLQHGSVPAAFDDLRRSIEEALSRILSPDDVVMAHNVLTTHFNLALTAAIHHLVSERRLPRLVVWCHDISRHVNPARDEEQHRGYPWDLLRTFLPQGSYVAVSSARQQTLAGILRCPPERIRVIPNGVDPVTLLGLLPLTQHLVDTYGLIAAELVILMPVRITRVKNIEFALRVVAELRSSGVSVRLVVTGPPDPHAPDIPDYLQELHALREQLSLHEEVHFVYQGTQQQPSPLDIDESIVGQLYRVSDVVLMPSLREGFGIPVLEAGLLDRVVFASDIPATQEVPGFQYRIEDKESPASVAHRISDWASGDAAHQLRTAVRQRFTWERIFKKQILPLIAAVEQQKQGASA